MTELNFLYIQYKDSLICICRVNSWRSKKIRKKMSREKHTYRTESKLPLFFLYSPLITDLPNRTVLFNSNAKHIFVQIFQVSKPYRIHKGFWSAEGLLVHIKWYGELDLVMISGNLRSSLPNFISFSWLSDTARFSTVLILNTKYVSLLQSVRNVAILKKINQRSPKSFEFKLQKNGRKVLPWLSVGLNRSGRHWKGSTGYEKNLQHWCTYTSVGTVRMEKLFYQVTQLPFWVSNVGIVPVK